MNEAAPNGNHSKFPNLFSPLKLGRITIRNRIVLLPMGSRTGREGCPTDEDIAFYGARAKGGVGLVITGGAIVHPSGILRGRNLYEPYSPHALPHLARLADVVHDGGAALFGQLFHCGLMVGGDSEWPTWGPSEVPSPVVSDPQVPHVMTLSEIEDIIAGFGKSAANLRSCGFDGVEIHAAHGYMVAQFLSPHLNRREDRYGGSPEKRMRFLLDIVDVIRTNVGPDPVLGVRMSGDEGEEAVDGIRLAYSEQVAKALAATGKLNYISVAMGIRGTYVKDMSVPPGPAVALSRAIRAAGGLPVIATQRMNHPSIAEQTLAAGSADMIGMARALICDWELAAKARDGRVAEIRPCVACIQVCRSGIMGCVHSPTAGRETIWGPGSLEPAATSRKVVVVGGGPAGMEAAMVAAERGHQVILLEAARRLGGQVRIAALAPHRSEIDGVISYRVAELSRLGVDVRLGINADAATVLAEAPDAVVIATGAVPMPCDIEGGSLPHVLDVFQVQEPRPETERRLAAARTAAVMDNGSGFWETCSAAEALARRGIKVHFITPARMIGGNLPPEAVAPLMTRLRGHDVTLLPMHRVSSIAEGTIAVFDAMQLAATRVLQERELPADVVVYYCGKSAVAHLADGLRNAVPELHVIGDCLSPRRINHATFEGHHVARAL